MKSVIAIYVENKYGVLARVSGLFMRRGFNIDTLTVGATHDPDYSRITITLDEDEHIRDQVINQLKKLHNVKKVKLLPQTSVQRELMLLKVKTTPENRSEVLAASEIYRAKIIDYNTSTMCIEVTGESSKIDAFIEVMKPIGIIEMCRTGVVALERGATIMEK
ncbi:MAG: acetolactate synthase small subunit [Clostridia bacterium]|jgi:acetolactate synthase-1/3 small subunit|nr:acetolactate synthase small subunit [Clostridia bacterium]MBQ3869903.1 acetolactate synthase small subunit [Clostridia bacterium]